MRDAAIGAHLPRRNPDGSWPKVPTTVDGDVVVLDSIGLNLSLTPLYAGTPVAA